MVRGSRDISTAREKKIRMIKLGECVSASHHSFDMFCANIYRQVIGFLIGIIES